MENIFVKIKGQWKIYLCKSRGQMKIYLCKLRGQRIIYLCKSRGQRIIYLRKSSTQGHVYIDMTQKFNTSIGIQITEIVQQNYINFYLKKAKS